jgi:hypothetical protein
MTSMTGLMKAAMLTAGPNKVNSHGWEDRPASPVWMGYYSVQ